MKKALMIAAALCTTVASAQGGRSSGSATTNLVFNMKVVPGCAVFLNASYNSTPAAAKYNGTDTAPETVSIDAAGNDVNLRCQTGTVVTISAKATEGIGNTFNTVTITDSTPPIQGRLSLVRAGFTLPPNNDDKTLEGDYKVNFTKFNVTGGNGDTYKLSASFTPDKGQFEPEVGDYSGTVYITINY
ncbi:hypothetical protein [Deinococcus aquaedulcis]|uniref:hypothetical protein n=1 Tax=Deinococcus aquaedulcis TaxID=2840455 RepID=UPI001C8324DF|nr:hypothetical protein [Deinococcus aquaedulcis]